MTKRWSNPSPRWSLAIAACAAVGLSGDIARATSVQVGTTWIDETCPSTDENVDSDRLELSPTPKPGQARDRVHPEGTDAARHRAFGRRLGVRQAHVVDPCDDGTAGCCPALWHAHQAFDASERGEGLARIAVYGNSLIAADRIINVFRRRLQEQFGDGGQGVLFVSDLGSLTNRDRSASRAEGWDVVSIADLAVRGPVKNPIYGVGGSAHTSATKSLSVFRLNGETSLTLLGASRTSLPRLEGRIDGKRWEPLRLVPVEDVPRTGSLQPFVGRMRAPDASRSFELRAPRGSILHGLSLERSDRGVIVDNFGLVSSEAWSFLAVDEGVMVGELDSLEPDLVVIMLGGNEIKRLAKGRRRLDQIEEDLRRFIRRVAHRGSESCLVVGPLDAVKGTNDAPPGTDPFAPRPQFKLVNDAHRHAALVEGCAFIDMYEAMGGADALRRVDRAGVLNPDLIHPLDRGLSVLGQLLADALLDSWRATSARFPEFEAPQLCPLPGAPPADHDRQDFSAHVSAGHASSSSSHGPVRAEP